MTLPTRFAAIAASALCLAAAPAAFAQQATTNGSSGTMSMEHGKDAMAHSDHMTSTKAKKSGMAQSGMAQSGTTQSGMTDNGAMSHSGDKMDKMEK